MGSSNWQAIPFCADVLRRVLPQSVLDVGVGFGRWGAMVREFCELWENRVHPSTWKVQVEGIEAFPDNIGPWHESFYNRIHRGDARQYLRQLNGPWDLVIFGDVLEHFAKPEALELLELTLGKAQYVLVNIPIGDRYGQGEAYGNPYEAHLSEWAVEDFRRPEARASRLFHDAYNRPYFSVVLSRQDGRGLQQLLGLSMDGQAWEEGFSASQQALVERARHVMNWANELDANRKHVEASLAWRLLRKADKCGLTWLPRKLVRLLRRVRHGKPAAQPVAAAVSPVAAQSVQAVAQDQPAPVASPAPAAPGQAWLDLLAGLDVPSAEELSAQRFVVPLEGVSDDFARLLLRRPVSMAKVFQAPALMTPQERVALYGLTFALAPQRYLEIGTCRGGSAVIVTAAMDDLGGGQAFGVDPLCLMDEPTRATLAKRFHFVQGPSPATLPKAAAQAGGAFDLVLVDGDHSREATLADLEGVLPLTAGDGAILIHDAYNQAVREAIDQFVAAHAGEVADCGMLARSPNQILEEAGGGQWGGLYMLRLSRMNRDHGAT